MIGRPWHGQSSSAQKPQSLRETTCCFTGHRQIPADKVSALEYKLRMEIAWLYGRGIRIFVTGGAVGFDTLAAQAVLEARRGAPDIQLHLYLPSPTQTAGWNSRDVKIYNEIRSAADTVSVIGYNNSAACMMQRNRAMVNAASCVIAYYNPATQIPGQPPRGGTYRTLMFAREAHLPVVNLYDMEPEELNVGQEWTPLP